MCARVDVVFAKKKKKLSIRGPFLKWQSLLGLFPTLQLKANSKCIYKK